MGNNSCALVGTIVFFLMSSVAMPADTANKKVIDSFDEATASDWKTWKSTAGGKIDFGVCTIYYTPAGSRGLRVKYTSDDDPVTNDYMHFWKEFPEAQDWSAYNAFSFMVYLPEKWQPMDRFHCFIQTKETAVKPEHYGYRVGCWAPQYGTAWKPGWNTIIVAFSSIEGADFKEVKKVQFTLEVAGVGSKELYFDDIKLLNLAAGKSVAGDGKAESRIFLSEDEAKKPIRPDEAHAVNQRILEPITQAGLKEMMEGRIRDLDALFKEDHWQLYGEKGEDGDRNVRSQSSIMMQYALHYKLTGRKEDLARIVSSFNWVYLGRHWNKEENVLFDGRYYLPNAIWATFMAIVLDELGDELPSDVKRDMANSLRGSADLCAGRSTGGPPSNTVVCNQDYWAVDALLCAYEYFKEAKYEKAAMEKLGYISLFEEQGFSSEFGVGPLYQAVGYGSSAAACYRLWDRLSYRGKCMFMDIGLADLTITTKPTADRRLGIEGQRSYGFPGTMSSCPVLLAVKGRNPFLTWYTLNAYHSNIKKAHSTWWLIDPVPALQVYHFYKYGRQLDADNQEMWVISWGAKARLSASKGRLDVTDEQSYIRSRTGLVAHFADKRLSNPEMFGAEGAKEDIQWNPGGLRYVAKADDVIIAADDRWSKPRLMVSGIEMADSEYSGSTLYRGVFASQYALRQDLMGTITKEAFTFASKLMEARHTFLALDDLLIVRLQYEPFSDVEKESAYQITHLRSQQDEIDDAGRYVLSQLTTSVGGGKPGKHALIALDAGKIAASKTQQAPLATKVVKDSLGQWAVPFAKWEKGRVQTRLVAIKPFATREEVDKILATIKPPMEINGRPASEKGSCLSLRAGDKQYYLIAAGEGTFAVKFEKHQFELTDSIPDVVNVFAFDDSGRLEGFSVYGKQCRLDGVKIFEAESPCYVSLTDLGHHYYASSDSGQARLAKRGKQWSLVTGQPTAAIRDGEIVAGKPD